MAQEEQHHDQHQFEKVKIEKPPEGRRVSSSFAALSLHPPDYYGVTPIHTPTPPATVTGSSPSHGGAAPATSPQQHDLFRALTNDEFKNSEEDLSRRLMMGEDLEVGAGGPVAASGESAVIDEAEEGEANIESSTASEGSFSPQHGRKASIAFARETVASDGQKRLLEDPLPRSEPLEIPPPAVQDVEDADWHDPSGGREDGHIDSDGSKAHEIPMTASSPGRKDSGIATRNDVPHIDGRTIPRTSALTVSTHHNGEPFVPLNGMLSPTSPTTPTTPTSTAEQRPHPFWPSRRTDSQRSRSYQRLEKAANGSVSNGSSTGTRRRSTRSANSSVSPASAFLSQLNRAASMQTQQEEPDDEGQEIASSGWIIGRTIGHGGFSSVKEVSTMDSRTGKRLVRAVKIMRKRPSGVRDAEQNERVQSEFEHEVALWRFLRHKYIVPLIAVYDTPFATFCITRLNVGGTLHNLIRSRRMQYGARERGLAAPLAKRYAYQLAAAIRYLHEDARIVHRDIKLENCLLDMTAPEAASQGGNILLCDFGMADYIQNESRDATTALGECDEDPDAPAHNIGPAASSSDLNANNVANSGTASPTTGTAPTSRTVMGSLEYAAPEVITATSTLFSPKADIWAYGVCVYALLTGSLPFSHEMREALVLMIEKSQWDIVPLYQAPAVAGGGVAGMAAVDLVKGCLTYGGEERWGIKEVLEARWLLNCKELYGDGVEDGEEGNGVGEWGK